MYYDDNNVKLKIDWKSLILKLILVLLVVLLIIWIFPMPKLDTFYNKVYNDNLNTMKEVSENYFTSDKLPGKTGDSVTLKLQDMLDKKLLTNFTDKNNNQCSNTNSFATVTKTDNSNYVLKVQLSCDDKTDYILENLNTASIASNSKNKSNDSSSESNSSTSNEENDNDNEDDGIEIDPSILEEKDNKYDKGIASVEYQYKKAITKTSTSYVCPEGYVKDNNVCYKYETGETIDATPLYFDDVVTKTDAKKNTTQGYTKKADVIKTVDKTENVCPEGYTLNGNICYKYTNVTVVPGTTTFTCPEGYVRNGDTCTITIDATRKDGDTNYTCPSGYTLEGTTCVATTSVIRNTIEGSTYYTCDNGGSLSGTRCYYNASYRSGNTTYVCPSGYSDNGSNCVKTQSYTGSYHAGSSSYGNCPAGWLANGSICYYNALQSKSWSNPTVQTSKTPLSVYENATSKRILTNGSSACTLRGCNYIYYYYTATISYSCPYGGSRSGSYCTQSRPVNTTSGYYTCDDGSRQSSSTCYKKVYTSKIASTSSGSYYCPNGGSLSGSQCSYSATYHKNSNSTQESCPSGYYRDGNVCKKTVSATRNTTPTTYSCPAGYSVSGTKCTKTIAATKNTTETQYTCPAGYVKEGTTCYQYTEPTVKKTYKYSCPEGFTKNGEGESTTCTKKVESTSTLYCENEGEELIDGKCVKKVKGGLRGYTCPSGYILHRDKCVKRTLECTQPQEVTNTSVTYEYKWSSESYLEGWTQTGKTRNVDSNVTVTNSYEK